MILGDFDLPDINWNTLSGCSPLASAFCDLPFELNLLQLIESPTHIHGNTLDIVLTNTDNLIYNLVVLPRNVFPIQTDHFLINFYHIILMIIQKPTLKDLTHVYNSNLLDCLTSQNVDLVWSKISLTIINSLDLFVPKFHFRSHQSLNECLHMAEVQFQQEVNDSKSQYETHLINSYISRSNSKLFHYIKSMTKSKSIPTVVHHNTTVANNDKDSATLFNQYFHSVFNHVVSDLPEHSSLSPHPFC